MIHQILILLLIILLLYFFSILPRFSNRSGGKPFTGVIYAHRGLFNIQKGIPENSLSAFREAVEHGYGIELDVQLSKDNQVVVFHDNTLSRICGIDLPVWEKTYTQLKELPILTTKESIPLLSHVLSLVDGKVPLLIEIKLANHSLHSCHLINEVLKDYKGPYCIESFNALALLWYRIYRPDVFRGQLSCNLLKPVAEAGIFLSYLTKHLIVNIFGRPDFISYKYKDMGNLSFRIHSKLFKTPVMAWTIKSQKTLENCIPLFHSYIFDSFIPETGNKYKKHI